MNSFLMNSLWSVFMVSSIVMLLGWLWQQKKNNAGIVDVLWAFGLSAAGVYYGITGAGDISVRVIVALLAGAWYARLAIYLYQRVINETEDGRYKAIRNYFGKRTGLFHFFFFQFQAFLIWMFTLPMWVAANNANAVTILQIFAIIIAVTAFIGESLADKQLADFRVNPKNKGKTCSEGLWRYSRHPNYFFEVTHWLAYPLLAWGAVGGLWVWFAPLVMFLFIYFITGIPYTERQAIRSRGQDYIDYQQTTSVFIPWKPKRRNAL